jgi:hypothetical protein
MFNATEFQLCKWCFQNLLLTPNEANTCVALPERLPNACRRSVRALSVCYHNNIGSQTTGIEHV